jgi:antitoxin MazE
MQVKLIKIGNSQGVRLPKAVLEQVGLSGTAELTIEDGSVVLRPKKKELTRAGWDEAFAAAGNYDLTEEEREWLDADLVDDSEWTW